MYGHHCSQAIAAFKACVLATKLYMLSFCKVCAAICCACDLWEKIKKNTKIFSFLRKKEQRLKNITTTFGKWLFITQYRIIYAIYKAPNAKDLARNLMMVAYENRQNAIMFARANNSDLLRALKWNPGLSYDF